jgi:succinoglycan biosynthesis transport protein ExoP
VRYRSEAVIQIEPRKVSEQYVTPNVASDLQGQLQSLTDQILSRTRLKGIIERFNLYPAQRANAPTDAVIDAMRKDITIELVQPPSSRGDVTAFRIYYAARSPGVAQEITQQLTSLFIDENKRSRTQQSTSTTNFLASQLEEAEKVLTNQEQRLREFKIRYLGTLPEQQQSNLQILSSLESRLDATSSAAARAEQQIIYLESLKAEHQAMQNSFGSHAGSAHLSPAASAEATLNDLRKQLTELEAKYTSQHPDVDKLKDEIAEWESIRQHLLAEQKTARADERNGASSAGDPALAEVESRLKATRVEIEGYRTAMKGLHAKIAESQARLDLTPLREEQLAEVTRNYQNSRLNYQSLLQKKLQSELATNLETQQEGEQFRALDPPSFPQKPFQPNRLQVVLIGWSMGLFVGLGMIAFREMTDQALRNEKDFDRYLRVPILVRIPVVRSPREFKRNLWNRGVEAAGLGLLIFISVALSFYTFRAG